MLFENREPHPLLDKIVKEYWVFESEDPTVTTQKIIPDGYSEIIIHYGNPYQINLTGTWETQASVLFSNQVTKYFYLRNTGISKMIGIKLYPSAFYELFHCNLSDFSDKVVPLSQIISHGDLERIKESHSLQNKIQIAENWLVNHLQNLSIQENVRQCISLIFNSHGMVDIEEIAQKINLSLRQLERLFKKVIGLTPKFYSRIIRFNYIFEVMKEHKDSWVKTALQSGYFDQSHFIKNFKEFTGEEPSAYGFDEINLANFFLKK